MLTKSEVFGSRKDPYSEKITEIRSSVLNAKKRSARRASLEKRVIRGEERARSKRIFLRELRETDAPLSSSESFDLRFDSRRYRRDMKFVVRERRDGDHDSSVSRWAVRNPVILALPIDSRLSKFEKLMGDGLGGRHAVTHVEWRPEYSAKRAALFEKYKDQKEVNLRLYF